MMFRSSARSLALSVSLLFSGAAGQIDNTQSLTKTATTAAQFLKIGTDPRASAMGNAFSAMRGDLSCIFWNPAGLAQLQGIQATFSDNQWLANTSITTAAIGVNASRFGVLGLMITNLSVPADLVRTIEKPEGTGEKFEARDLAVIVSYSRSLTDRFSIGGNVKFISQSIWHSKASTIAGDFGALFILPFNDLRLGASLSNFGGDMRMTGRDQKISVDPDLQNEGNVKFVNADYETDGFPLPLMFRVGLSGEVISTNSLRLSFGLDAIHPNDNTEALNVGVEATIGEMFFLRTGYSTLFREDSEEGLTLGGGIHYRLWRSSTLFMIDYSYSDVGRLEGVQRIAVGFKF